MKYNINTQKIRRNAYFNEYIKKMKDIGDTVTINPRETVWHCMVLLSQGGEYAKKANRLLKELEVIRCHFMPMNFTQILVKYSDFLEKEVKEKLEKYVLDHLIFVKRDRIHISMYNDNFANMAIYTCLIAGQYFDDKETYEMGVSKLEEVLDVFSRCGVLMEFGSPTYTAIDTLCFAEMVEHIKDKEVRDKALYCEKRMWIEMASHYHPETSKMAGPYSRAYAIDSVGHPHLICGIFWYVFGDKVFTNPINNLFKLQKNQIIHGGLLNLTYPNIGWILDTYYHCDNDLIEKALHKEYPYTVECMTECIPSNYYNDTDDKTYHEYGGYRGLNTSYMMKDYTLGTSPSQFHGGAGSESFYITYANTNKPKKLEDSGVIYSRYIFNDRLPETDRVYEVVGKCNCEMFRDEGRKLSIQKDNIALVSYKAKQYEKENVFSSKNVIMIPIHFFEDIKIYTKEGLVTSYPTDINDMQSFAVEINNLIFGFSPLEFTNYGRKKAMRIDKKNNHLMIEMYNYEGETKSFTLKEMFNTQAGFVNICEYKENFESIEEFFTYLDDYKLKDIIEVQEGATSRKIKYSRKDLEFNLMFNPMTESVFVDTINKKPRSTNIFKAENMEI